MEYLLTPFAKPIDSYYWIEGAFSNDELNWLQDKAKNATEKATTGGGDRNDIRRSQVNWLSNSQETHWVFGKLGHIAARLNSIHYNFNLTGFGEPLQLTNYNGSEEGMYVWHQDFNVQISRKLSIVLQLTDPSEYEGGNLQILTGVAPVSVKKQRGIVAVFPSFTLHQVTPVTQGTRQSLVAWVSGPPFK
jgi:PKHD-type hydroxylase